MTTKAPFKFSARTRVGFSDTDAQGIVYYGRYNPYFDLARVEYHRCSGCCTGEAEGDFVMRANDVEYFAPARFDDELEIYVRVSRIGRTSVTFEFAALQDPRGHCCSSPRTRRSSTSTSRSARRTRVPDDYRATRRRARGRRCRALAAHSRRSSASSTRGGDADDILRQVVAALHDDAGYAWAGIFFVEEGDLVARPARRHARRSRAARASRSTWQGDRIAELAVDDAPEEDRTLPRARRRPRLRSLPRRLGHRRRVLGPLRPFDASRAPGRVLVATGRRSCRCPLPFLVVIGTAPLSIPRSRVRPPAAPNPSFEGTARLHAAAPERLSPDRGTPPCAIE